MTDNKNEEFPIVDEMGNILGAITRGHAHDGMQDIASCGSSACIQQ